MLSFFLPTAVSPYVRACGKRWEKQQRPLLKPMLTMADHLSIGRKGLVRRRLVVSHPGTNYRRHHRRGNAHTPVVPIFKAHFTVGSPEQMACRCRKKKKGGGVTNDLVESFPKISRGVCFGSAVYSPRRGVIDRGVKIEPGCVVASGPTYGESYPWWRGARPWRNFVHERLTKIGTVQACYRLLC